DSRCRCAPVWRVPFGNESDSSRGRPTPGASRGALPSRAKPRAFPSPTRTRKTSGISCSAPPSCLTLQSLPPVRDELLQTFDLPAQKVPAGRRDAVDLATLPLGYRFDQPVAFHAGQGAVQRTGSQFDPAPRDAFDELHDAVAVQRFD